jgi:hypothetical protein
MANKTCGSCLENDDYLCDLLGIWVDDDDNACEKHRERPPEWHEQFMNTFLAGH